MKKALYILVLCSAVMLSCSTKEVDTDAIALLEKSAEAYGGVEKWNSISEIKFQKWTMLLDSLGQVESETNQTQVFQLKPKFTANISWMNDGLLNVSKWDGEEMSFQLGDNPVENEDFLAQKKRDMDAAFYAFAQPWKLLDDPEANITYLGERVFNEEYLAYTIRVDYGPDSDIWWYYFDPQNFLCMGNEVQLKDHRSLIVNGRVEQAEGMIFHGARTSYRVDENGKKLYVRARYQYSDYELGF